MVSLILSLVILGVILLASLIGWLIDRFSNRTFWLVSLKYSPKKENIFVAIKNFSKENAHWIVLYFFILTITQAGIQNILSSFNMSENSVFESSLMFSFILVSFTFYQLNKKRHLIINLRAIIKLAAANDTYFISKLSSSHPRIFLKNRDIPLSLILEKQREISAHGLIDDSGTATVTNFLKRSFIEPKAEVIKLAKEEVSEVKEIGKGGWRLYADLKLLDSIILEILPDNLIKTYEEDIYFLRLNLLAMELSRIINKEILILENPAKGEEITYEFYKSALNKYYMHEKNLRKYDSNKEYVKQPVSFNIDEFESYLKKRNRVSDYFINQYFDT